MPCRLERALFRIHVQRDVLRNDAMRGMLCDEGLQDSVFLTRREHDGGCAPLPCTLKKVSHDLTKGLVDLSRGCRRACMKDARRYPCGREQTRDTFIGRNRF